mgnify:FL=1
MPVLTKRILTYLTSDPTPNELARFFTMVDLVSPPPRGATINFIDDSGTIFEIARFGLANKDPFIDHNSIWSNLEPFKHVRQNELAIIDPKMVAQQVSDHQLEISPEPWLESVLIIPVASKGIPIGAIALMFDVKLPTLPKLHMDYESLQALLVLAFRTPRFNEEILRSARGFLAEVTDLELEIIKLIARGYTNKQIGQKHQIALPTVKAKISKLLRQFEAKNRKDLVAKTKRLL